MARRDDDDEAADESRVATWLGLRSSEGRRGGLLSRRSWLLILLLFLCCLSVFLFSGQRATRTNCGEEEVVDLRACVRGCDRPQGRVGLSGDVRSAFLLSS